ncbi:RNA recognition motif (rrm) domain containing protein [Sporothrix schenckii 1099-18]|uniref:RNA recognition motif (Rrm) domain containing protein n=1 Tax=Sporothrix schenckii 1099-18 TaxID=1397361 RepID=A0A0F2LQR5_SPOSC|nr:RNA recognition motif (rrm) domain containing protein [Sporothrix schenckii 1099-18]KJR79898.1 RNA recognition motif (rrm) domain containing protein [Sporothrix schenckii 1099-18]
MANCAWQRERSRSPHRGRSRSPGRSTGGHRRSFSPRNNRSRSPNYRRTSRRSRSPMAGQAPPSGTPPAANYSGGSAPHRSQDDRTAARDQMLSNVRDSSQQDRRVYVGNLSYDVKWHHLKDFMRQAGEVLFADVLLLPNGMSKVGDYNE